VGRLGQGLDAVQADRSESGLIVVEAEGAQYWESPGVAPALVGIVAAVVTHKEPSTGDSEKVDL
jgi:hypothetical protein